MLSRKFDDDVEMMSRCCRDDVKMLSRKFDDDVEMMLLMITRKFDEVVEKV